MDLIASYGCVDAIGIGMPGQVLPSGEVKKLGNIKHWKTVNLKKLLEKRFKVPVNVINDAKAFTLAEAVVGGGRNFRSVVGIILGTGIGSGIVFDRQIYIGSNSLAGEIGHIELLNGQFLEQEVRKAGRFNKASDARRFLRTLISVIVRSVDPEIILVGGGWSRIPGMQKELEAIVRTLRKFPPKTKVKVSKLNHAGIIGACLPLFQHRD